MYTKSQKLKFRPSNVHIFATNFKLQTQYPGSVVPLVWKCFGYGEEEEELGWSLVNGQKNTLFSNNNKFSGTHKAYVWGFEGIQMDF